MLLNLRFALGLALLGLIFAVANASATGQQDPNSLKPSGNSGPLHAFGANLDEAGGTPGGEKGKPSKCDGCLAVEKGNEHVNAVPTGDAPAFHMHTGEKRGHEGGGVEESAARAEPATKEGEALPLETASRDEKTINMIFARIDHLKKRALGQVSAAAKSERLAVPARS